MSQRPQGSSKAPKSVRPEDHDDYESVHSARPLGTSRSVSSKSQASGSKSVLPTGSISVGKTGRMKSEYPIVQSTIYEDAEWEKGRLPSQAPKSMTPRSMMKGSQAPRSRLPSMPATMMNRGQGQASMRPTMLNRDQSHIPKSSMRSMAPKSSMGSIAPKSSMRSMAPTMLNRDKTFVMKSVLRSQRDVKMASRMTSYASLPPAQQEEQDEWQREMAKNTEMCPDGWEWVRRDGGYMCEKGGHGQTDEQIAEGMGSIVAMPKGKRGQWELRQGPYYKTNDNQWKWNSVKGFPGIHNPDRS